MSLDGFVARYGLVALFVGAGLEGETAVTLGGTMAHRGLLAPAAVFAAAAAGSFVADTLYFAIGRRFRDSAPVRRWQARPAFVRALATFDRYPLRFAFGIRFAYGLRTVGPIAIGTTAMPAARFVAINAVSACVWAALFTTLGYLFGNVVQAAFGYVSSRRLLVVGAAAAVAIAAIWIARRRR